MRRGSRTDAGMKSLAGRGTSRSKRLGGPAGRDAGREGTHYVFFRLDDVGLPGDAYRFSTVQLDAEGLAEGRRRAEAVLDLFVRYGMKADLAVVPWHCERGSWEWLRCYADGRQFEMAQHGFRHQEHGCREFGPGRTAEEQRADILMGRRLLRDCLGMEPDIFVPPSNKYDRDTVDVLAELGFRILSAGAARNRFEYAVIRLARMCGLSHLRDYPVSHHEGWNGALWEMSISVDAAEDYAGARLKSANRLIREVQEAVARYRYVGVMLHPWLYSSAESLKALEELLRWIGDTGFPSVLISQTFPDRGLAGI